MSETIAAVATGGVLSAIGVIRLSGDGALAVIDRVFRPLSGAPMSRREDRKLVYGALTDAGGETIDLCLCTVSRAPHSYTGEDTAELQCHGSPTVLREGLEALFAAGARQALAGEFTKRAFLNGKLDLTQAEAVIDLIEAETAENAKNAAGQLGGAIRRKTDAVYDLLRDISSHYHAVIDYPDEDIEPFELSSYAAALDEAEGALAALLRSFDRGRVMNQGVPTAIVGRPNAGKSTLLNALLGYDRAIVTDIPGTTRDTVTEKARLGGVLLRLTDTAGVRDARDEIERLGVERSRRAIEEAGLILLLIDASGEVTAEDMSLLRTVTGSGKSWILLPSKLDRVQGADLSALLGGVGKIDAPVVPVSAKTGAGFDMLARAVSSLFPPAGVPAGEVLTNARHYGAVQRALESLRAARAAMTGGLTPDAVLTETETAMAALGELTGRTVREDVTERIFERFCVGK